jgi:hypothetical protein
MSGPEFPARLDRLSAPDRRALVSILGQKRATPGVYRSGPSFVVYRFQGQQRKRL